MQFKSKAVPSRSVLDPSFQYTPARLTTAQNLMEKYRQPTTSAKTVVSMKRKVG
jgi:hypothetical protein